MPGTTWQFHSGNAHSDISESLCGNAETIADVNSYPAEYG